MGCWHETCGVTGLPIVDGDPIRMMAIRRVPQKDRRDGFTTAMSAFDIFHPITILAKGTYDDYGWINFEKLETDEEARFFNTALAVGVGLRKNEQESPSFPPDHFQWMIREDAFQMLDDLPLDHWSDDMPKTVGEGVRMKRDKAKMIRAKLEAMDRGDDDEDFRLREEYNDLFGRGEMPYWPLKTILHQRRFRELPSEQTEEVQDACLEDLLVMWKLYASLGAMRKILAPTTTGELSQDWNSGAYMVLSKFYETAVQKWKTYLDT